MRASEITIINSQAAIEYQLERPTHGQLPEAMTDTEAAFAIQRVGQQAWAASEWLDTEASSSYTETPTTLTKELFDPTNNRLLDAQIQKVQQAQSKDGRVEYFLGTTRSLIPGTKTFMDTVSPLTSSAVEGFVKITRDGERAGAIKYVQRATGLGMYACIHDVSVVPSAQRKGLATTLIHAGLSNQPNGLRSSLYTALSNEPMIAWADRYGYYQTDEYEESDLFTALTVPFARFEAARVGQVLEAIEADRPELTRAVRLSLKDRQRELALRR